jgi:hypothetical protein
MALGDFDGRWKNPQGNTNELLYLWAQDLIKELRKGEYISNSIASGIANSELADMAAWTIKMRNSAAAGDPQDQTINDLTEETSIVGSTDFFPMWDASGTVMRKAKVDNMVAGLTNVPGMRLLTSGTASGATLDIVLTNFTSFRAIKFVLMSFVPATDDVELWMRFSSNGGSSYDATGYTYALVGFFDSAVSANIASAAANQIEIAGFTTAAASVSNVANEGGANVEVTLFDQTAARYSRASIMTGYHTANDALASQVGNGQREAAQDTDAVRFLFESGNITSGKYAVYGLA